MTEIPTYLLWVIGAFLPIVALVVGIINVLMTSATSRRDQTLNLLKWAAEQAVADQNPKANLMGTKAMDAMNKTGLLKVADRKVLWAITAAVLAPVTDAYPEDSDLPIVVEGDDG